MMMMIVWCGLDESGLGQGKVMGFYEHGDEISVRVNSGNYLTV